MHLAPAPAPCGGQPAYHPQSASFPRHDHRPAALALARTGGRKGGLSVSFPSNEAQPRPLGFCSGSLAALRGELTMFAAFQLIAAPCCRCASSAMCPACAVGLIGMGHRWASGVTGAMLRTTATGRDPRRAPRRAVEIVAVQPAPGARRRRTRRPTCACRTTPAAAGRRPRRETCCWSCAAGSTAPRRELECPGRAGPGEGKA